jgi:hypothetical protein
MLGNLGSELFAPPSITIPGCLRAAQMPVTSAAQLSLVSRERRHCIDSALDRLAPHLLPRGHIDCNELPVWQHFYLVAATRLSATIGTLPFESPRPRPCLRRSCYANGGAIEIRAAIELPEFQRGHRDGDCVDLSHHDRRTDCPADVQQRRQCKLAGVCVRHRDAVVRGAQSESVREAIDFRWGWAPLRETSPDGAWCGPICLSAPPG